MTLNPTTLGFEALNFLVLMYLLYRIVYRPLRQSLSDRRKKVEEDIEEARQARHRASELEARWQGRDAELGEVRRTARQEALEAAEQERVKLLARAQQDAEAERAQVKQLLAKERAQLERWVDATVWERGTDLAGRMLTALAPDAVNEALAAALVALLERHAWEAEAVGPDIEGDAHDKATELELTGARMPDAALAERIRRAVEGALARPVNVTLRQEGELLAGYTLRVAGRLFDASVAGELAALREMARDLEAAPTQVERRAEAAHS